MFFRMDPGLLKYFFLRLTTDDVITIGTRIDFVTVNYLRHDVSLLSLTWLGMIPTSLNLSFPQAAAVAWEGPLLRATIPG